MPEREEVRARADAEAAVREGDLLCLADARGERILLTAVPGAARVPGVGVVDLAVLVGRPWGGEVAFGSRAYRILQPGVVDRVHGLERKAQIVTPKDAAHILLHADVRAGKRVLEAGAGTGALTVALAAAVAPGGLVTTVEVREDFLRHARANVERAGVSATSRLVLGDATKEVPAGPYDAVVLDLPAPEEALPVVSPHLVGGGHVVCYTPLVSQAEAARRALDALGYGFSRTVEVLERELVVGERGSRPAHDMLAHTAYLTYARKLV